MIHVVTKPMKRQGESYTCFLRRERIRPNTAGRKYDNKAVNDKPTFHGPHPKGKTVSFIPNCDIYLAVLKVHFNKHISCLFGFAVRTILEPETKQK